MEYAPYRPVEIFRATASAPSLAGHNAVTGPENSAGSLRRTGAPLTMSYSAIESAASPKLADVAAMRFAAQPPSIATKSLPQLSNAAVGFPEESYTCVRSSISESNRTSFVRTLEKCAGDSALVSSVLRSAVSRLPTSQCNASDGFQVPRQVVPGN